MHSEASASRRRHGESAASESAAAQTSAATQPNAEAALARAAVSVEQSEGWVERARALTNTVRAHRDAACIAQQERVAASWRAGG